MREPYIHIIKNYQKEKPFASFLSGVSGQLGIPLWAFYVNRGQLISSFGVRNKNGAIAEFYPANLAYHYTPMTGFRTFIKLDNQVYECFKESSPNQELIIKKDSITITETHENLGFEIRVTYFTLPNEKIAALVRKVELINLKDMPQEIEVIDGLAQILPAGVDFGSYKAMSNLLQSWMQSIHEKDYVFYKLRASTDDSAEVSDVYDGNFLMTLSKHSFHYISDYKLIFAEDTSLSNPYGFLNHSIDELKKIPQTHVNQVPCAMIGFSMKLKKETVFYNLIGYASNKHLIDELLTHTHFDSIQQKQRENERLHESLVHPISTFTSSPLLDEYFKQCYLDNLLRGGTPIIFDTLEGPVSYYLFSRKHGDLERDYNFFHLEPGFYSQGNGNFRDVLQNRRNDIFFHPEINDFNIYQFGSLIQADGYNPLSIEGIQFQFHGDILQYPQFKDVLSQEFTPGKLATHIDELNYPVEQTLKEILKQSKAILKASYGEGYWGDHFTYLYDVIESYLEIYPDKIESLMYTVKYPFFVSPATVLARNEKYVMTTSKKIRQYGAIKHGDSASSWLENQDGLIKVNLLGKLITLILNKFGILDYLGIGLSYEANKPGWNDAANGLPGLFGSGVSETFELIRITKMVEKIIKEFPNEKVVLLKSTEALKKDYKMHFSHLDWEHRSTALEHYRKALKEIQSTVSIPSYQFEEILSIILKSLDSAVEKAKKISDIYPTYLTYEADKYELINDQNNKTSIGHYGLPLVKVHSFSLQKVPHFLEAPARYLKALASKEEAKDIYLKVKKTGLYDQKLNMYQTSESLDESSHEIGRLRAFTPGWLERESNFLHMTYKFLLGLLKSGLYEEFYDEIKTNFTCFMDSKRYGRSPLENSSFIATSSNPDPKKHGQGFVARLSGSTAEVLSMWKLMFLGDHLFTLHDEHLEFKLNPKLHRDYFIQNKVETLLFGTIKVVYHNDKGLSTFDPKMKIHKMILYRGLDVIETHGDRISGKLALEIRDKKIERIDVFYQL